MEDKDACPELGGFAACDRGALYLTALAFAQFIQGRPLAGIIPA